MDLGNTIKKIRKQKGLTQLEFASSSGITQTYLSQIENNQRDPNLSTIKLLSKSLNIPIPVLFFLSMTEEDIPPHKRDAFKIISPSINSLVNEFFTF
ncbi:MAG: helix-turn-helix domain-containing protein [bacterium]